jgi:hypothetical protein
MSGGFATNRVHGWIGRKDRHPVAVEAIVRRVDGSDARAVLTNMSDDGCRIESSADLRIGEEVEIAIPGVGQVQAQIRWALPGSAGAHFL